MGYYRAALAAADSGDLTAARRLARISIASGEGAPSAVRLLDLLAQQTQGAGTNAGMPAATAAAAVTAAADTTTTTATTATVAATTTTAATAAAAADTTKMLRELTENRQYRKALKIRLPESSANRTIRGMLYALLNRRRRARKEFAAALALDRGNAVAWKALMASRKIKKQKS